MPNNGLIVSGNVGIGTISPIATVQITRNTGATSGFFPYLQVDQAADTGQTAESPTVLFNFDSATRTWATGTLATQRYFRIDQPTIAFAGSSTVTNVANIGVVGAPVTGTNATVTNTHGILVSAGAVSTATNSYGLSVNAQTGATNNYVAQFIGGNVGVGIASPGSPFHVFESTANTGSTAGVTIQQGSTGDSVLHYICDGTTWSEGIDNSDSNNYKISASSSLGTTDVITTTTAGYVNFPLQPKFLAYVTSDQLNVTGNGTTYTIFCQATEFDVGAGYNTTTGVYTAPATGTYAFGYIVAIGEITAAMTTGFISLVRSVGDPFVGGTISFGAVRSSGNAYRPSGGFSCQLTAGQDIRLNLSISNGVGNTADVLGNSGSTTRTCFWGYMIG